MSSATATSTATATSITTSECTLWSRQTLNSALSTSSFASGTSRPPGEVATATNSPTSIASLWSRGTSRFASRTSQLWGKLATGTNSPTVKSSVWSRGTWNLARGASRLRGQATSLIESGRFKTLEERQEDLETQTKLAKYTGDNFSRMQRWMHTPIAVDMEEGGTMDPFVGSLLSDVNPGWCKRVRGKTPASRATAGTGWWRHPRGDRSYNATDATSSPPTFTEVTGWRANRARHGNYGSRSGNQAWSSYVPPMMTGCPTVL